jgi:hypothetical protein
MNKSPFDSIMKEYSFLDDYEKDLSQSKTINSHKKESQVKTDKSMNSESIKKDSILNNYKEEEPEIPLIEQQANQLNDEKEKMNKTRYGAFVNKNLDYDKLDDLDYVYSNLEVDRSKKSQEEIIEGQDRNALKDAQESVKKFEYRFYAFLNKEFNILNKKMLKCSIICYQDPNAFTTREAKLCAEACHKNIQGAAKFVEDLQEKTREKLSQCIESAKDFTTENSGDEKVVVFFNCYDNLIADFGIMEKEIKKEFSYFI